MEVERISEMLIRPSSPTPSHLRTYKISLLDQFMPSVYTPLILFYPNHHCLNTSLMLKQSLSEILSLFYALAGKIRDHLSIDCNDEGSYYVNARVHNISLSDYLNRSDLTSTLHKLLPNGDLLQAPSPGSYVCMIQETCFPCGGMAITTQFAHMAIDGMAMASFLKAWANVASKSLAATQIVPYFDAPFLFPQYIEFPREAMILSKELLMKHGKLVTKRFLFEASALESLKAKAMSSTVENPTRVEVVSALLCKSMKRVAKEKKSISVTTAVNLRARAKPMFPECSMGNLLWTTNTVLPNETELESSVESLRGTIRKIDSEFVNYIRGEGGFFKLLGDMSKRFVSNEMENVGCSSWCNFGFYDIDFGWGKPLWVSCVGAQGNSEIPFMNLIVLMDAKVEKGIEAWVFMDEVEMSLMEKDEELLAYALVNPSPVKHR